MSFLFPGMLWALSLISIPIIVHLFNLRRAKKVYFSNVQFLNKIKSTSSSKLVLKHYLALLFRILFITFLVLAFAQPFYSDSGQQVVSSGGTTIFLDNSYSNSNLHNGAISCFERNFAAISALVESSSISDRFSLVTNDKYSSGSKIPLLKEKFLENLSELTLSPDQISFDNIQRKMANKVNGQEVYIFSDFQKDQFPELNSNDTLNSYFLVPTPYVANANVFIDSIYLDNYVIDESRTNTMTIKFTNAGTEGISGLSSNFLANGIQLSTNSIDVPARKSVDLKIDLSSLRDSINVCEINFEDYPVTFDNRFHFVIKKSSAINVFEIRQSGDASYFQSVYGSHLFNYNFSLQSNIDYSKLRNADLVIVNELPLQSSALVGQLESYLSEGGNVLIIPHPDALNIGNYRKVAGNSISETEQDALGLDYPDLDNPIFKDIFDSNPKEAVMPYAKSVLQIMEGEPLLKYLNNSRFMSRITRGDGNVFISASSLRDESSDFARNALFLPIMYNIAFQSAAKNPFQLYSRISEGIISIKLNDVRGDAVYKLKSGEKILVPEQRIVDGKLLLNLEEMDIDPGIWELLQDDVAIDLVAVNFGVEESRVTQYSLEELEDFANKFENISVLDLGTNDADFVGIQDHGNQKNLWKYALMFALLFLFAEVLTLRFL